MRRKYKLKNPSSVGSPRARSSPHSSKAHIWVVMFSFVQDQQRPQIQIGLGIRGSWFAYKSKECRIRCATKK